MGGHDAPAVARAHPGLLLTTRHAGAGPAELGRHGGEVGTKGDDLHPQQYPGQVPDGALFPETGDGLMTVEVLTRPQPHRPLERTYGFVERVGIDRIRAVVVQDSDKIAERLDSAMQASVDAYADPWSEADSPVTPGQFDSATRATW